MGGPFDPQPISLGRSRVKVFLFCWNLAHILLFIHYLFITYLLFIYLLFKTKMCVLLQFEIALQFVIPVAICNNPSCSQFVIKLAVAICNKFF